MSLGWLLALLVLLASLFAIVFASNVPPWLEWVLIAMLALAMLVSDVRFPWRPVPPQ